MARTRCPICRSPHSRLGRTKPLTALRRAPSRFASLVRRARRRLVARRPRRGEWAINEVLCHLADAEVIFACRLRKMASEPGAVIPAFDQNRWAEGNHYRRTPAPEALKLFAGLRESNLAHVRRLRRAQLKQHGKHPEYGRITMSELIEHWAEHDLNHLEQARQALATLKSR